MVTTTVMSEILDNLNDLTDPVNGIDLYHYKTRPLGSIINILNSKYLQREWEKEVELQQLNKTRFKTTKQRHVVYKTKHPILEKQTNKKKKKKTV